MVACSGQSGTTPQLIRPVIYHLSDVTSYRNDVTASSPAVYYELEEATGPSFHDSSGNGLNGTGHGTDFVYQQPGALSGTTNYGIGIGTRGGAASITATLASVPSSYTLEGIFKQPTRSRGTDNKFRRPGESISVLWPGGLRVHQVL